MNQLHPLANDSVWAMYYRDGKSLSEIALAMNCPEDVLQPRLTLPMKLAMDSIASHCVTMIADRNFIIASHEHAMLEQTKVVDSMSDLLATISGNKIKNREKAEKESRRNFKFARNTNYLQSVGLGLREGLWNAPLTLFREMKVPLGAVAGSVILVVGGLLGWITARFILIGAGFAGRVTPVSKQA